MSAKLEPNLEMAQRFLNLLDENGVFTFQTFSDKPGEKNFRLAQVIHGRFANVAAKLVALNQAGAGIFVMVNEGDGNIHAPAKTCRTIRNIIRLRAHILDLDGAPLDPVLAADSQPHIVVQSSPGKWHVYWKIEHGAVTDLNRNSIKQFYGDRQVAIAQKFGGDKSIKDLPRVLRLPGFFHQKKAPFMSCLMDVSKVGGSNA